MQQPELRALLNENIKEISEAVRNLDFLTYSRSTPIIPVLFGSRANAEDLSEFLKANNIIVPYITYPVKTNKFIVRITVSACHSKEQIQELIDCLIKWRKNHGSDKD
jgi:7-keto-8-aminopelargonate synthetase-like enzyme